MRACRSAAGAEAIPADVCGPPSLWILCADDPREGLAHAGARAKRGFARGVYQTPAVLHTGVVVLSQLPETPDTLILRLMGVGRTLQRALAELKRLPEDARERHMALPALLEYRLVLLEQPTRTPEDEEFLMDTHDIVQQLKDEGRHEGRHEAMQNNLLTIYHARFGSVPRKVRAAVERTHDDAALARWVEIFAVRSAAEIIAAVAQKKA